MATQSSATTLWGHRAERLLEQALDEVRDGIDALPTLSAAEMALRIECGEAAGSEMCGYPFPGEDEDEDESGCSCPPDLRQRGGFKSTCRVHGA